MAGTYTYPGVYVEEIPSGVRTITGVSTSDTAFVDYFPRGPVDDATRITSFGDFERNFGGLHPWSEASYAIQQFFLNGGQVAWVVRINNEGLASAYCTLQGGSPLDDTLTATAKNPGAWGNNLQVAVVQLTGGTEEKFNLLVREVVKKGGKTQVVNSESHLNLSMKKTSKRYAIDVVNEDSDLVVLTDEGLGHVPAGVAGADNSCIDPDTDYQDFSHGDDGSVKDSDGEFVNESGFLTALQGDEVEKTGIYALDKIAPYIFNILCLPAAADLDGGNMRTLYTEAETYCAAKRAFLIVDISEDEETPDGMADWMSDNDDLRSTNAAVYFPRLTIPDVLNENRPRNVAPSGTLAGVYARTDATRGVWKAPAGTDAKLRNATLTTKITDAENGGLNPFGINVLRNFPIYGNISWGGRTLYGADQLASEWKYIPVRRTALFLEESLYQGLKWVVFEPNDEPLWAQIRLNVGAFMHNLFRQGAFQGTTPKDAYFVKCDKETTTQNDIDNGIVNILVGFAPLKPAEFVVIKIQQIAGQIET
jgi:phage tail sheath protein FI